MAQKKGAIVIGASSGLGRALAFELSRQNYDLIIAAREERDLQAISSDLELRFNNSVVPIFCDLGASDFNSEQFVRSAMLQLPRCSLAFITAGVASDEDVTTAPNALLQQIINVNFINVSKLIQSFALAFQNLHEKGSIVTISSIAAGVPRSRNIFYAAAKRATESVTASFQHALGDKVRIQTCRLGYVDSSMTYGKKLLFPVLSPERASKIILKNLSTEKRLYYCPSYWFLINTLLGLLPWTLYKRLKF